MHQRYVSRLSSVVLFIIGISLPAFALRQERLIDAWRPTHYDVTLSISSSLTELSSARAEIQIVALKTLSLIDLDFGNLTIDSVLVNGSPVSFDHSDEKLAIKLPSALPASARANVTVTYHGKPTDGLIFKADRDGKPSIVGDNWPNRVHYWIPSFDHPSAKATVTFKVTAPAGNLVVANGRFRSVETGADGTRTWTYNEGVPIPPYCMVIGVGDFAKLSPREPTITPLSYYVSSSDRSYALKGFAPANPVLQMFSELVGPYPYEKLDLIIGATQFGGMENSSAIVFPQMLFTRLDGKSSRTFGIPESIEAVVAHEIAHQWFGDSVTESTWADLWLSEGFATYFAGLFLEQHDGEEAFQAYMNKAAETAIKFAKRSETPIHDRVTPRLFDLLNANNYQKGAWVLHMLRERLGDAVFFRAVRTYYATHKDSTATTEDLRSAMEKASGMNLRQFFQRWVYEGGCPRYEVKWQWLSKTKNVTVSLTQGQSGNLFADPVPITINTPAGKIKEIITPGDKTTSITVHSSKRPTGVTIDPQNTLLKEVVE